MRDFSEWLNQEIEKRGWSYSELGRRAGISHSTISLVLSKPPAIEPFSAEQIRALLEAVKHSNPWKNRPHTTHTRTQEMQLRDRALILFLLDTGVRATELCNLLISDVDLKSGMVHIRGKSRLNSGQGKARAVFIGKHKNRSDRLRSRTSPRKSCG